MRRLDELKEPYVSRALQYISKTKRTADVADTDIDRGIRMVVPSAYTLCTESFGYPFTRAQMADATEARKEIVEAVLKSASVTKKRKKVLLKC